MLLTRTPSLRRFRPGNSRLVPLLLTVILAAHAASGFAQIKPSKESLSELYPGKAYSPYAQRRFPDRVFWGDTHLHTGLSMDAGLFGARLGLEEAYRFARGEEVMASSGQPVRLGRQLDWLVITDHSDGMGFFNMLVSGHPELMKEELGRRWRKLLSEGKGGVVAREVVDGFAQGGQMSGQTDG